MKSQFLILILILIGALISNEIVHFLQLHFYNLNLATEIITQTK
jgi:hypothetical protein